MGHSINSATYASPTALSIAPGTPASALQFKEERKSTGIRVAFSEYKKIAETDTIQQPMQYAYLSSQYSTNSHTLSCSKSSISGCWPLKNNNPCKASRKSEVDRQRGGSHLNVFHRPFFRSEPQRRKVIFRAVPTETCVRVGSKNAHKSHVLSISKQSGEDRKSVQRPAGCGGCRRQISYWINMLGETTRARKAI